MEEYKDVRLESSRHCLSGLIRYDCLHEVQWVTGFSWKTVRRVDVNAV